jgi:hypothetical protein
MKSRKNTLSKILVFMAATVVTLFGAEFIFRGLA